MMRCERCYHESHVQTMSRFNTQMICILCDDVERKHPDYEKARETERAELLKGNRTFEGIGLPKNLT